MNREEQTRKKRSAMSCRALFEEVDCLRFLLYGVYFCGGVYFDDGGSGFSRLLL